MAIANQGTTAPLTDQREKIIQQIQTYFARTGVRRVSMFGSFGRNEFTPESDVDLLLEVDNRLVI